MSFMGFMFFMMKINIMNNGGRKNETSLAGFGKI